MSPSGSCLGLWLQKQLQAHIAVGKPWSRAGSTTSHFGDGQTVTGFGSTTGFSVAGGFLQAKTDGALGGGVVSWPSGMRNQSSVSLARAKKELEPAHHNLPEHLLCQASRDSPKPSTDYGQEKNAAFHRGLIS